MKGLASVVMTCGRPGGHVRHKARPAPRKGRSAERIHKRRKAQGAPADDGACWWKPRLNCWPGGVPRRPRTGSDRYRHGHARQRATPHPRHIAPRTPARNGRRNPCPKRRTPARAPSCGSGHHSGRARIQNGQESRPEEPLQRRVPQHQAFPQESPLWQSPRNIAEHPGPAGSDAPQAVRPCIWPPAAAMPQPTEPPAPPTQGPLRCGGERQHHPEKPQDAQAAPPLQERRKRSIRTQRQAPASCACAQQTCVRPPTNRTGRSPHNRQSLDEDCPANYLSFLYSLIFAARRARALLNCE